VLRTLWGRARRVPLRRWPALVGTAVLVGGVELGLRTVRLPRLARWMGVPLADTGGTSSVGPTTSDGPSAQASPGPPAAPLVLSARERRRVRDLRRLLAVPGVDGTCLRQGLLVGRALRRHDPRLVLGVAKKDGVVTAHAWIELEGWVVDDFRVRPSAAASFEPLAVSERR
jgi:hypothetical protein